MTAVQIIEEIKRLPRGERNKVLEFARRDAESRLLTPEQLGDLAKRMVETQDLSKPTAFTKRLCGDFTARNPMPKIRRRNLPQALLAHLLTRMRQRGISHE